jgi:hypothetical protein
MRIPTGPLSLSGILAAKDRDDDSSTCHSCQSRRNPGALIALRTTLNAQNPGCNAQRAAFLAQRKMFMTQRTTNIAQRSTNLSPAFSKATRANYRKSVSLSLFSSVPEKPKILRNSPNIRRASGKLNLVDGLAD